MEMRQRFFVSQMSIPSSVKFVWVQPGVSISRKRYLAFPDNGIGGKILTFRVLTAAEKKSTRGMYGKAKIDMPPIVKTILNR